MSKTGVLHALVLADIGLAFTVIAVEMVLQGTLPPPLRDYVGSQTGGPAGLTSLVSLSMWATSIALTLVAWIGLLGLWPVARGLYLSAWIAWIGYLVVSGPAVMTQVGGALDTVEAVVGGAILGLVYFSDLARVFDRGTSKGRANAPISV